MKYGSKLLTVIVAMLAWCIAAIMPEATPAVPRTIKYSEHQFVKRGHGKVVSGGYGIGHLVMGLVRAVARAVQTLANAPLRLAGYSERMLVSGHAAVATDIKSIRRELQDLYQELDLGQKEMEQGLANQGRIDDLTKKAKLAERLQASVDQYDTIAGSASKGREVKTRTMPTDERKSRRQITTTPGHLFVASDSFRAYRAGGKHGWSAPVDIKSVRGGRINLHGDEADRFEIKAFDAATLPDLGTDAIIQVDRDQEIVRFQEPEILTIRDLLQVVPTTSDTIKFVRHTATERGAASQASRGALKDFLKVTFAPDTVAVETIAVLSKVTEQDIDDAPRLVGYINGEMRLDVKVEEERQLLWGDGSDGELEGLYAQGVEGTYEFDRAAVGDTILDTLRKMRTDLRKRRVMPNGVVIDPLDWETAELAKSSEDEHYLWALITDLRGPRVWSTRVIESDAATNAASGERRVLMGDFIRGGTLYDRHDVRLAVGFMDDDFGRNLRTLRAEERLALAVKRPFAFEYAVTEAGS